MKVIEFHYKDSCLMSQDELKTIGKQLEPEIKVARQALTTGYDSDYASINLSTDTHLLNTVQAVIQEKKALKPMMLVVIGIGGSNLGTMAVHEAIQGKFYNEQHPALKVYWADSVDADYIGALCGLLEQELQRGGQVLLNVVSKSGATTETIANFQVLLPILKNHRPEDYFRYVVATTDKDSALWHVAQQEKFVCLEIPKKVGGRYSVFSAVGLFPLGMLGVDIKELLEGARSMMPEFTDTDITNNPAALSAAILATHYKKGLHIHDTFLFANQLESVGKWYRQLMGESIGKEFNRNSERVCVGMTPTVSVGSTDLHSVGQLYLGGPKDKVTTFVTVCSSASLSVPYMQGYNQLVEDIQGRSLSTIMDAIIDGVQIAYTKGSLPYVSFKLTALSPFFLGQFLQCKMLEIMYLGYILDVNPFDQPNVELYKQETRKRLSHE
ncbi:MAG: hypothetical protein NTX86_02550 [Candidatus Dependentiae bacterium]|nr:hypothetical protein [Candidatus Dependentiae bacterium]